MTSKVAVMVGRVGVVGGGVVGCEEPCDGALGVVIREGYRERRGGGEVRGGELRMMSGCRSSGWD